MAALNWCFFGIIWLSRSVHQPVLKFWHSVAIALRTFNRFWIVLYQILRLKYEDSENLKADCVSTVVVNLH